MTVQGGKYILKRNDLLFPELSFKINGILFDIFKQLGGGHKEIYYQRAVEVGLENIGIPFEAQYYVPLTFEGKIVGKYYLDILVDKKIIIEMKRGQFLSAPIINQTKQYLEVLNLPLALIACFTHTGVYIKRIVNHNYKPKQ